jgi:hypothetical protein
MEACIEIIVHDNGSDDPETLEILDDLRLQDIFVVRKSKILSADELNNTNETVDDYFRNKESMPYIVSDCDVDMSYADPRAISVYLELVSIPRQSRGL